jgi:pterin-4a-carbinolamine dehydratase
MQHHPRDKIFIGKGGNNIFTHDSCGLTELDFYFAQKVKK